MTTTDKTTATELPDWINPAVVPDGFTERARALADDLERFERESGYHELMERAFDLGQEFDRWSPPIDDVGEVVGPAVGMDRVMQSQLRINASAQGGCEGSLGILTAGTVAAAERMVAPTWVKERLLSFIAERDERRAAVARAEAEANGE
jgi:hypothetical protein